MSRPYSIHLSTAKSWRGGENQIFLLTRGLLARGQRVLVLAPKGAPLLERCAAAGIPARALTIRGELDLLGALRLARVVKKEGAGILHLHDGHAILPGQLAARLPALRKVMLVAHRRTVFKLKNPWKYSGRVDRVIAISAAVKDQLVQVKIPEKSIRVVYSGMEFPAPLTEDDPLLCSFREQHGIARGDFVIAHAAALTAEKRQGDIIDAVAIAIEKLKEHGANHVHLAIAGSGEREQGLREAAKARKIEQNVHFLGFLTDLRPLWSTCNMAIFASEAEGLCTALIEAQGAGLPAVVTRAGGMVEVVEDGKSGEIVAIGDVRGISNSILKLHGDADLRRFMGANALLRARSLFSAEAMIEGVKQVYKETEVLSS